MASLFKKTRRKKIRRKARRHDEPQSAQNTNATYSSNDILQLQSTHGNQFVLQMLRQGQIPAQTSKPKPIQRLNTTENYYYKTTEKVRESNAKLIKKMRKKPEYSGLLSNVRMYHMLANNPFSRANAGKLLERLDNIYRYAGQLDGFVFKYRRSMNNRTYKMLDNMTQTALDDVRQDRDAITALVSNNAIADGSITWKEGLFVTRAGIPIESILTNDDLAPGVDGSEVGNPESLGGGAISDVTALDYSTEDGGSERRVFKPHEVEAATPETSVDGFNVQSTYRALATSRVHQLIATKMAEAGREFKELMGSFDVAKYNGAMGNVSDFAEGKEASKNIGGTATNPDKVYRLNIDISDISLQQQLANLQLFDVITGQIDRHIGNIMVDQSAGSDPKVTAIDNDFTFSTSTDITKNVGKTTMPEKIDRYFAEAILDIATDEFVAQLKGLRQVEKDAAVTRLEAVQAQLSEMLNNNELLVAPGDNDYPGAPNWADVDISSYRTSSFGTGKKDYAMEMYRNRLIAYEAVKNDPTLQVEQDAKGNWVLEYQDGIYLQAMEDDGSDLKALVDEAKIEYAAEHLPQRSRNPRYRGRQRGGVTIGSNRR